MERRKGSRVIPRHAAEATTVASFRTWRSSRHPAAQSPEPSPDPSTSRRSDEAARRRNGIASGSQAKRGLLSAPNQEHSTLKIRPVAGLRGGLGGRFCPGMPGFLGFLAFFCRVAMGLDFGRGVGGVVLSGFARIFGFLDLWMAAGGLRGSTVSCPRAPLHGLADGLGEWLGLLAGFFVVLLF